MSTKHLRRLLKEKERQLNAVEKVDSSSSDETRATFNKFAVLDQEDDYENDEYERENSVNKIVGNNGKSAEKEEQSSNRNSMQQSKKLRKKKCKRSKYIQENDDIDSVDLLDQLFISRTVESTPEVVDEQSALTESELFKFDFKLLDADDEQRKALGLKKKNTRSTRLCSGRKIVKFDPSWPPVKNLGFSFVLDSVRNSNKFFKFVHSKEYIEQQRLFWFAVKELNHHAIMDILGSRPYHLDSLLMVANVLWQQEDCRESRLLIERALYGCQSVFPHSFELNNFDHNLSYEIMENRIFFLLLNQHTKNVLSRKCYVTALNLAKLVFGLCPMEDPMGILLIIDAISIQAKQYSYLIELYNTIRITRRADRLPNFSFSRALAHFLIFLDHGNEDAKETADEMLRDAIYHFPTVLLQILECVGVTPTESVLQNKFMCAFAHHRESEGFKLLVSIYLKHTSTLWKEVTVISWLEAVTENILPTMSKCNSILLEWNEIRGRVYGGIPRNIQRHAFIWDVVHDSEWTLNDPVSPYPSRSYHVYLPVMEAPVDPLNRVVEIIRNNHRFTMNARILYDSFRNWMRTLLMRFCRLLRVRTVESN